MFQERVRTLQGFSVTVDVVCLCIAFAIALILRIYHVTIPLLQRVPSIPWQHENVVPSSYAVLLGVSVVAWVLSMRWFGLYEFNKTRSFGWIVFALLRACCLAVLATGAAGFVLKMSTISRLFFVYYSVTSFMILVCKQTGLLSLYRSLSRGEASRHALVIGAGRPASWLVVSDPSGSLRGGALLPAGEEKDATRSPGRAPRIQDDANDARLEPTRRCPARSGY